ncbi:hypothetical protein N657DRAFT_649729 [Parathielavia appendiculata]|uniref:Uncharacterized protein n=1 Tax=Parathielavia appendiculata TaxID=2587402 RepID=A0AAN6Z034_9PEZI|nr:hypothetical protein N657DRAFT_649729 [Parathielavia appendiculata]
MVTLRDLLLQPAFPDGTAAFHTLTGAGEPSLSHKSWVADYPEVLPQALRIFENPDQDTINTIFGDENALDHRLLTKDVMPLNDTVEWFQKEGDSVRAFYTHISHPIQLAFHTNLGPPFIIQRSESGPLGQTQVSQTVDFSWGCGESSLMIGELKRHGIINTGAWITSPRRPDGNRVWLGKELRAYCHKYKCFAASGFDGRHLLILVFQAQTVRQIGDQNCPVTGLLFAHGCPTLQYGLFRTVTQQIGRMQATTAPPVTLDGYVRRFRYWSGAPYWVDGNNEYEVHPTGYIRMLDVSGAWYWAHLDGQPVLYEDGGVVWDTAGLGL